MPYKNPYIFKTRPYTVSEKPILASFKTKSKAKNFIRGLRSGGIYAESPKAVPSDSSHAYKETYGKITDNDEDLFEEEGKFEIISSGGVGDSMTQNAYVEGYYVTSKGKVYFKKIWDEEDTFIVKGNISQEGKEKLFELIEEKYSKLTEFD